MSNYCLNKEALLSYQGSLLKKLFGRIECYFTFTLFYFFYYFNSWTNFLKHCNHQKKKTQKWIKNSNKLSTHLKTMNEMALYWNNWVNKNKIKKMTVAENIVIAVK